MRTNPKAARCLGALAAVETVVGAPAPAARRGGRELVPQTPDGPGVYGSDRLVDVTSARSETSYS
jgi:hypothetical protein